MKDFSVSHVNTNLAAFPSTAAVQGSSPTATDGTEYVKGGIDETWGAFQALLNEVGLTPNGSSEVYTNSQILESIRLMTLRYGSGYGIIGRADTDSAHDVILSVGHVPDSTRTMTLRRTAEISKQGDVAWSAGGTPGTPAGGLMGGAWSANTQYGIFEIYNPTTKARDAGFSIYTMSAGIAVPSFLPAGYTVYQIVDWVLTDGASAIIQTLTQDRGGGYIFKEYITKTVDINLTNTLTNTRRTDAIRVPLGFKCWAGVIAYATDAAAGLFIYISDPDTTDGSPGSATYMSLAGNAGDQVAKMCFVMTTTAGLIGSRGNFAAIDSYIVSIHNFLWKRF